MNENTPAGINTEVRVLSYRPGVVVNPGNPAIEVAAQALADIFGRETVFVRSGGSIPIVADFANHLGLSDHPDGVWSTRRWPAFAQRKI